MVKEVFPGRMVRFEPVAAADPVDAIAGDDAEIDVYAEGLDPVDPEA